ncbi:MAG: hypothetical protein ACK55E_10170 [Cyanobacteriota bacterium]|jgi:predicted RNase H-like HicB family nuclease
MPFVNEVVSDADIDRYGLPFEKGSGRYWTRDAERDFYLWGGKVGNPAFDEPIQTCFRFFFAGRPFLVYLEPGEGSRFFAEVPFRIVWKSVLSISPICPAGASREELIQALKEALLVYGEDGRGSKFAKDYVVSFLF